MAAMPSHRFIAQLADRMDDIDTYKRKRKKSVEHHYERFEKTKENQEGFDYQSTEVFSPVSFILCTHSVLEVISCLSVCWGFRVKKPPITYRNRS